MLLSKFSCMLLDLCSNMFFDTFHGLSHQSMKAKKRPVDHGPTPKPATESIRASTIFIRTRTLTEIQRQRRSRHKHAEEETQCTSRKRKLQGIREQETKRQVRGEEETEKGTGERKNKGNTRRGIGDEIHRLNGSTRRGRGGDKSRCPFECWKGGEGRKAWRDPPGDIDGKDKKGSSNCRWVLPPFLSPSLTQKLRTSTAHGRRRRPSPFNFS